MMNLRPVLKIADHHLQQTMNCTALETNAYKPILHNRLKKGCISLTSGARINFTCIASNSQLSLLASDCAMKLTIIPTQWKAVVIITKRFEIDRIHPLNQTTKMTTRWRFEDGTRCNHVTRSTQARNIKLFEKSRLAEVQQQKKSEIR